MRINIAEEEHKEIINNLLENNVDQSVYHEYSDELLNCYINENGKYILLGDEFVCYIGYIFFTENKEEGYITIDEVIIDSKYVNQGYEERMLYYVLKYAKGWGITYVKLNSGINNPNVEVVIKNHGFTCQFDDSYILKLKNEKI